MKLWTKMLEVPVSNATKQIEAVQMWEVRWQSRIGNYPWTVLRPELEALPSREAAEHFRDALKKAFKLLRYTSDTDVTISDVNLNEQSRIA